MSGRIRLLTIGFTKKSAAEFFGKLKEAGVTRVIDTRLNNTSQLAGFTKQDDLEFFLRELAGIEYEYLPSLAPTKDLLDAYKKHGGDWSTYEVGFNALLQTRNVERVKQPEHFHNACLLCSEEEPHHCHRRLVAEYLRQKWGGVDIVHLI